MVSNASRARNARLIGFGGRTRSSGRSIPGRGSDAPVVSMRSRGGGPLGGRDLPSFRRVHLVLVSNIYRRRRFTFVGAVNAVGRINRRAPRGGNRDRRARIRDASDAGGGTAHRSDAPSRRLARGVPDMAVRFFAEPRVMSDVMVCACGHEKVRHFSGSMVRGTHACLIPLCECRRFQATATLAKPKATS